MVVALLDHGAVAVVVRRGRGREGWMGRVVLLGGGDGALAELLVGLMMRVVLLLLGRPLALLSRVDGDNERACTGAVVLLVVVPARRPRHGEERRWRT